MCILVGWDGVLVGIINEEGCNKEIVWFDNGIIIYSDCGNYKVGVMFLIFYLVISFFVVVNMYIVVILENFS